MKNAVGLGILLLAWACGGSDGGGSSDDDAAPGADSASAADAAPGSYTITLDTETVDSELLATTEIAVTVTPTDGFEGTVTLAAAGLPDTVTATFTPPTVDLSSGPADATLALTVPSTITPTTTPTTITVGDATFTLTIQRAITIDIVPGATTAPLAFGPRPIVIHAGTISMDDPIQVRFYNQDSVPHEVHAAQMGQGFAHDATLIAPDAYDPLIRNPFEAGSYDFYLHDLGDTDGPDSGNTLEINVP